MPAHDWTRVDAGVLFLTPERYVNVPLEQTYMAAYRGVPRRFKQILERA